jgi:hypothetical protein
VLRTLALALMLVATAAVAQMRAVPVPAEARLARMSLVEGNVVDIDGVRQQLAPGAQIRDESNRIIIPGALPPGSLVCYLLDGAGLVHRVWILTPEEAAGRG